MQFVVNYTLHEIIFNTINHMMKEDKKKCNSEHISEIKKISISSKLGTVPLHQLFKALHKIGKMFDLVQVANTFPNQHSSGVELPSLFVRINPSFVEHTVFLFLQLFDNCCDSFHLTGQTLRLNFLLF